MPLTKFKHNVNSSDYCTSGSKSAIHTVEIGKRPKICLSCKLCIGTWLNRIGKHTKRSKVQ